MLYKCNIYSIQGMCFFVVVVFLITYYLIVITFFLDSFKKQKWVDVVEAYGGCMCFKKICNSRKNFVVVSLTLCCIWWQMLFLCYPAKVNKHFVAYSCVRCWPNSRQIWIQRAGRRSNWKNNELVINCYGDSSSVDWNSKLICLV